MRQEPLLSAKSDEFQLPYQSRLWVAPGPNGFCMLFLRPRPCWWFRLWQYAFFGFVWEKI
jgi:hypothetical protein